MVYVLTFTIKKQRYDVRKYTLHGSYGYSNQLDSNNLIIFQHTPGTYPRPSTNSFLLEFCSLGALGMPGGMRNRGMLGFTLETQKTPETEVLASALLKHHRKRRWICWGDLVTGGTGLTELWG